MTKLIEAFRSCHFAYVGEQLREAYDNSNTRTLWENFYSSDDAAGSSLYGRFLAWLRAVLLRLGNLMKESAICSFIEDKLSLKKLCIALFAAYLPIEYLLRDVLHLSIASVWEELFILLAAAVVIWRNCLAKTDSLERATTLEAALLLYMGVGLLLMMLNRPWPAIAFAGYRAQFEYIVWFFLIIRLLETEEDSLFLLRCFLAVIICMGLHGVYQYIVATPIPTTWTTSTEMGVRTRVFSITGSPNIFGSILVMAAPIAAGFMYYEKSAKKKVFWACITGLLCLCDLFTFSRGSWVGLFVAVLLFAMLLDKRLWGFMLAVLAAILVAIPSITSRLTFLFTSDYAEASARGGRAIRWELGRNLLMENGPWLGFGLGRFGGAVAMNNQVLDKTEEFSYFYLDNYYLKTMVEIGYIGLICLLIAAAALLICGIRTFGKCNNIYGNYYFREDGRRKDNLMRNAGNPKCLAAGILAGLTGVLVHCFFENIFEEPYMMAWFWGLAACLLSFGFFKKKEAPEYLPRVTVLGTAVDNITMDEAVSEFKDMMKRDGLSLIATPNAQIVYDAYNNPEIAEMLKGAQLVIPDGVGLIKAADMLGTPLRERVAGIDFAYNALKVCAEEGRKVYFLGGKPGIAQAAAEKLTEQIPGLCIAGCRDGYFKASEESAICEEINSSGAEFLCLAMGCPKQEFFARDHKDELNCKAAVGIGGSFDVWSGTLKRAPEFFRKLNLEWLYRMIQEPKRFKRFTDLPAFLIKVKMNSMKSK